MSNRYSGYSAQQFNDFNQRMIDTYRANKGVLTEGPFAGAALLLLTTTGAKSGRTHTTPLAYTKDGNHLVIIASKGGAPTNPAWYHNLVAHPVVTVEVNAEKFQARAIVAEGAERERLYNQMAAERPTFDQYRRNTTRQIPVIVLQRIA